MALRTPLTVSPHMYIGDSTGRPLDYGMVYFGEPDKDPEFYPIDIFSDDQMTRPVSQPLRTKGGFINDSGDMIEIHAKEIIYSVKVLDQYGRKIFYKGEMMRNNWNDDVIEQIDQAIELARQSTIEAAAEAVTSAIEAEVAKLGFIVVDSFELGATLTQRNQALRHEVDGKLYRWAGDLPKVVPVNSTPVNTGGTGLNAWLEVSDITLRQEISAAGGVSKIEKAVSYFNDLTAFNAAESAIRVGSSVFLYSITQGLDLEGEGRVYTYQSDEVAGAINVVTTNGFLSRPFDGKIFIAELGAKGVEFSEDTAPLDKCFGILRQYDGGILSMGEKCTYYIKGELNANLNNLDWQWNHSTAIMGYSIMLWEPHSFGYGNYKNLKVTNAVFKNGIEEVDGGEKLGGMFFALVKVDDIEVSGCTFEEISYGGHFLDLMGCRYVEFHHNTILGRAEVAPLDKNYYEFVQTSRAITLSFGRPKPPEQVQYWDGVDTHDVHMHHNTFKPFIDPVTGRKSFPAKPIGDHLENGVHRNITVEHNHFEDITSVYENKSPNTIPILSMHGIDNIQVNYNNFIVNESPNKRVIRISTNNERGDNDVKVSRIRAIGNTITSNIASGLEEMDEHRIIEISHNPPQDTPLDAIVKDNVIDVDIKSQVGIDSYGIGVYSRKYGNKILIEGNALNLVGGFDHHIYIGSEGGGEEVIKNNITRGLLTKHSIHTRTRPGMASITVSDNTLYDQWRSLFVGSSTSAFVTNNKFIGYSSEPFKVIDAEVSPYSIHVVGRSGDAGKPLTPVLSSGNVVLDDRVDSIIVSGETADIPEWQYLVTAPYTPV